MNRTAFFAAIRNSLFGGRLNQAQVDGIEAILDEGRGLPLAHMAYCLATAHGETGSSFVPIQENMNYSAGRIPQVFSARRLKGKTP